MRLDEIFLSEAHYSDLYPAAFTEFVRKYNRLIKSREIYPNSFYIHFGNVRSDNLDKRIYSAPDHSDPAGLYTYPLSYVLKNPADIWYGQRAMYMQVIRATNKAKPLYLQSIRSETAASTILNRMGISYREQLEMFKLARKAYHVRRSSNRWGALFMAAAQCDFSKDAEKGAFGTTSYHMLSATEQSRRFLTAGYNLLIDDARTPSMALIHQNEPSQAVFLRRDAWEVVETIQLRQSPPDILTSSNMVTFEKDTTSKIASKIAGYLKDSLTSKDPLTTSLNGWHYYWTRNGRRIEIYSSRRPDYYDRPLGQKPHKYDTTYTDHVLEIVLDGERGRIKETSSDKERFETVIRRLVTTWSEHEVNPKWAPETQEQFEAAREAKRRTETARHLRDQHTIRQAEDAEYGRRVMKWINAIGRRPMRVPPQWMDKFGSQVEVFLKMIGDAGKEHDRSRPLSETMDDQLKQFDLVWEIQVERWNKNQPYHEGHWEVEPISPEDAKKLRALVFHAVDAIVAKIDRLFAVNSTQYWIIHDNPRNAIHTLERLVDEGDTSP